MKCFCIFIFSVFLLTSTTSTDFYYKSGERKGWKYIVIHHSATNAGSAKSFHNFHTKQGWGGLAYHFVIGNSNGTKDGEVETGFRWKDNMIGTHVSVNSWEYNIYGIGIVLVGNFMKKKPTNKQWKSLVKLAAKLAKAHKIPVNNIIAHKHVPFDNNPAKKEQTLCPGKHLDIKALRSDVKALLAKSLH